MSVAERMDSSALLDSVRSSFVAGMDTALLVGAAVSAVSAILALAFLPGRVPRRIEAPVADRETFRGGREPRAGNGSRLICHAPVAAGLTQLAGL